MATQGTITQVKDAFGALIVTHSSLFGSGNISIPFHTQGYPFGTWQIVQVGGALTGGDTLQLQGSNDGVNFQNIGPVFTVVAVGSVPASLALLPLGITQPGTQPQPFIDAAPLYYQVLLTGNVGTYTLTFVLMGTRG